jgi:NADPH:quinone reductase-like Zn-dependent oxidoreductase
MKAIVMQGDKKAALVEDRPEPKLRRDYILIKTKAVALNPTDWKHIDFLNTPGCLLGCDYAGVVEEVGPSQLKKFSPGDRVCGFTHGGNSRQPEDGSFAEKIVARSGITMHMPDSWSFETAATIGVGLMTCGQGLYQKMNLAWPDNPSTSKDFILIYGGSSATGTIGIQFATLSGYRVITTCSSRNFDLVKGLGAEAAFDYNDPAVVEQIQKHTDNNLKLVWDTICLKSTVEICAKVLAHGGHYGKILNTDLPGRPDVTQTHTLGYTSAGEPFEKMGKEFGAEETQKDYEFMHKFMLLGEKLIAEGKIKAHPMLVNSGLENVLEGEDLLRNDKVSGKKLVYTV